MAQVTQALYHSQGADHRHRTPFQGVSGSIALWVTAARTVEPMQSFGGQITTLCQIFKELRVPGGRYVTPTSRFIFSLTLPMAQSAIRRLQWLEPAAGSIDPAHISVNLPYKYNVSRLASAPNILFFSWLGPGKDGAWVSDLLVIEINAAYLDEELKLYNTAAEDVSSTYKYRCCECERNNLQQVGVGKEGNEESESRSGQWRRSTTDH